MKNMIGIVERQEKMEKELKAMKKEAKEKQDIRDGEMEEIKKAMKEVGKESKKQEKKIEELSEELKTERKGKNELEKQVQAELTGVKKDVGEVGKNVESQKARYDEVLKIGISKEKLEADPKRAMEERRKEEREMQMQMVEVMERDKRRNNLIVMGIEENKTEQEVEDKIREMIAEVTDKERVEMVIKGRVGKIQDNKCRPLRVEIQSPAARRLILKKASTLKKNKNFEKIYVVPDLTRKQQEEDKQLRDKLKEFRGNGMEGIKISKGCIVKEQGSDRQVLFGVEKWYERIEENIRAKNEENSRKTEDEQKE